jgi:hypothetical protein
MPAAAIAKDASGFPGPVGAAQLADLVAAIAARSGNGTPD